MKENRVKNIILYTVFGIYVVFGVVMLFLHEPWHEEAQTYLMCRDLGSIRMIKMAFGQGESVIWMMLIYPLIHMGLPIYVQNVWALILVLVAVYLLLFKSTIPWLARILICISPLYVYFYPNIAESYALIPFLLALLAYYFPKRFEKPGLYACLIALLFHSHIEMWLLALIVTVWFAVELIVRLQVRSFGVLLMPFASMALLIAQIQVTGTSFTHKSTYPLFENIQWMFREMGGFASNDANALMAVILGVLIINLVFRKKDISSRVAIVCFAVSEVYAAFLEHNVARATSHGQFILAPLLILVWAVWIMGYEVDSEDVIVTNCHFGTLGVLLIFCVVLDFGFFADIKFDITDLYSDARNVAAFLDENVEEDAVLVSMSEVHDTAILPHLKLKDRFVDGFTFEEYSYMDEVNYGEYGITFEPEQLALASYVNAIADEGKPVYIIMQYGNYLFDLEQSELMNATNIYQTKEPTPVGENFAIFKIDAM